MARETFVRYRTLCLLAALAVLSCLCVGLLVAVLGRGGGPAQPPVESAYTHSTAPQNDAGQRSRAASGGDTNKETAVKRQRLTEPWEKDYRIPASTYAMHYDLFLHPNLETGLFSGTVDIHVR